MCKYQVNVSQNHSYLLQHVMLRMLKPQASVIAVCPNIDQTGNIGIDLAIKMFQYLCEKCSSSV